MYSSPNDIDQKTILIAALNWGLGHVFRSAALIRNLAQHNKIIVACSAAQIDHFQRLLSNNEIVFEELNDYPFQFNGKGNWLWDGLLTLPALKRTLKQEVILVQGFIKKHNVDVTISDHRYGFYSITTPSIFVTHQIHLPLPWYAKWLQFQHQLMMKNFSEVWIMDTFNNELAGKLSKRTKENQHYIGWWSAYENEVTKSEFKNSILVIVSGPQPYNCQFQDWAINKYKDFSNVNLLSSIEVIHLPKNWRVFKNPDRDTLNELYQNAQLIVSRSGYTSFMDAKIHKKKVDFIATSGQLEQEYLLKLHQKKTKD